MRDGKRIFETLKDCPTLKSAQERKLERQLDIMRGTVPVPVPRPAQPARMLTSQDTSVLTLNAAIGKDVTTQETKVSGWWAATPHTGAVLQVMR
jgi:hypothetical protein